MSVGTGEFIGVPPLLSVMMTPSTVTEEVVFGTGTTIVVAVLVTVAVDVTVVPVVNVIIAVEVLAGMVDVPVTV